MFVLARNNELSDIETSDRALKRLATAGLFAEVSQPGSWNGSFRARQTCREGKKRKKTPAQTRSVVL